MVATVKLARQNADRSRTTRLHLRRPKRMGRNVAQQTNSRDGE